MTEKKKKNCEAAMVYYALEFTAELDGLTNLQPRGGCDDPNFTFYFKVSHGAIVFLSFFDRFKLLVFFPTHPDFLCLMVELDRGAAQMRELW